MTTLLTLHCQVFSKQTHGPPLIMKVGHRLDWQVGIDQVRTATPGHWAATVWYMGHWAATVWYMGCHSVVHGLPQCGTWAATVWYMGCHSVVHAVRSEQQTALCGFLVSEDDRFEYCSNASFQEILA